MKKSKVAITGASGLLGNKIIKHATTEYTVIPIHRTKPLSSNSLELDITYATKVSNLLSEIKPDVVIHAASETNVDKCEIEKERAWKINAKGTLNIAKVCRKVSAKLIYISTDYVFDGEKGLYDERDEPNPINYYGITKLEGEKQVIAHCKNYAILRTSVLYGWHPWNRTSPRG